MGEVVHFSKPCLCGQPALFRMYLAEDGSRVRNWKCRRCHEATLNQLDRVEATYKRMLETGIPPEKAKVILEDLLERNEI